MTDEMPWLTGGQPTPTAPPGPPPKRGRWSRRTIALVAGGVLVLAAVAVTVVILTGGSTITAHGSVEVDDFQGSCLTDYPDLTAGTQVVVTDSGGSVIGTTELGYSADESSALSALQPGMSVCVYPFTVKVPGGQARYGITVSHRGTVWFTSAEMVKGPGLSITSAGSGF
jgi:hypothetical protein